MSPNRSNQCFKLSQNRVGPGSAVEKKGKRQGDTAKSVSEASGAVDWGGTTAFFLTAEPGLRLIQTSLTPTPVNIHEPHGPHGGRGLTKQTSTAQPMSPAS